MYFFDSLPRWPQCVLRDYYALKALERIFSISHANLCVNILNDCDLSKHYGADNGSCYQELELSNIWSDRCSFNTSARFIDSVMSFQQTCISAPQDRSRRLRASCSSLSPVSASVPDNHNFTARNHLMLYLNQGVPKRMCTNIGAMFPNMGLCVGVLGSRHSSVIRVERVSVSASVLHHLHCLYQRGLYGCLPTCVGISAFGTWLIKCY